MKDDDELGLQDEIMAYGKQALELGAKLERVVLVKG